MATAANKLAPADLDYPDSDGEPIAETPQHRNNLAYTIESLDAWFADDPDVYVSGNMFVYYVPGDRLRHVSPDVFVVRDIPKRPERRRYLVWEENKAPDVVFEFTSASTQEEDRDDKFRIYRDILSVREYFLFDPLGEYQEPRLCGYRLQRGRYVPIKPVRGRLASKVLGLHLEAQDWLLRLYDPRTRQWLSTPPEERRRRREAEADLRQSKAENARLRRELES
jgi:Uma2 family endonuclease